MNLYGNGYGDKHNWEQVNFYPNANKYLRTSHWKCANCKQEFFHAYHAIKDIFAAIKAHGIPEECIHWRNRKRLQHKQQSTRNVHSEQKTMGREIDI